MPRPDPERLQPGAYPVHHDVQTRFGDLDPLNHLNNAALARLYEDARVRFIDGTGLRRALVRSCNIVVAELSIRYLAQGRYPDAATIGSGVLRIGQSSVTLGQALFQNGHCIGTCDTVLVQVETASGAPAPLTPVAGALLAAHLVRTPDPVASSGSPRDA